MKQAKIAVVAISLTVVAAGSAQATTCKMQDDSEIKFTRKYEDTDLKANYYSNGGSKNAEIKKFYIYNWLMQDVNVDDIQLLLRDEKGDLLARVHRGPNLTHTLGGANAGAIFDVPWEDGYELWVEVRWKGDVHYKHMDTSVDDDNVPFKFTETKNGLIVARNTNLEVAPLYSCS
ncbi:hypothetical protein [Pseudoruegeria sp. HB172150]|uniref:hypothetical protein n=1 Tax=Pseudoruegeria sp. HB172150 TaxID=2721164 RepID=UPI001C130863|nr:hypothetical protein [Pseudoruegeria sp. HB172150]